jgi:hypothetical protein
LCKREWQNDAGDIALNVLAVIHQVDIKCYRGAQVTTYRWSDLSANDPLRVKTSQIHIVYSGAHYDSTTLINDSPAPIPEIQDSDDRDSDGEGEGDNKHEENQAHTMVHLVDDDQFAVGAVFGSWESVYQTAENYSKTRYFRIVKKHQKDTKTGLKTGRILCSRAGKPVRSQSNEEAPEGPPLDGKKRRKGHSLKCGCAWKINLKGNDHGDSWTVTSRVLEHTNECKPSSNQELVVERSRGKPLPPHVLHSLCSLLKVSANTAISRE